MRFRIQGIDHRRAGSSTQDIPGTPARDAETKCIVWYLIEAPGFNIVDAISLSPNERILAGTPLLLDNTVYLWNLENDQLIKILDHAEELEYPAQPTFSADGKFLITSCEGYLYRWDVFAIVKEAGIPLDILDATPQPAPKLQGAPRIPPGFFDDALREANARIRLSQSHGPHVHLTSAPHQRTFDRFHSFWQHLKSQREPGHHTASRSHPLRWNQNLVSGILRRRDGSDIQLQEVEVPYTAGKPRNYHARKKKPIANSSRPSNIHTTQQPNGAAQSTPTSSPLPPPAATATATSSTIFAVAGTAGVTGTPSRPHIIGAGWRARFVGWLCCMPIQNTGGHH
ncbi:uncharacterized protein EDB93DRAFT_1254267 [Suillus bovinus]|uniref:uncharacterized protein n=1 Tax=Suillus bovinus TaxID=48563 RepID=UPI001B86F57D|nr:uncharacterized protein EDB93DRAFT_1254267 [Suillus bovinus]KAG2135349.1 hypothetical protein EDB93DRAFT_1254267 [Suillus bovinus]